MVNLGDENGFTTNLGAHAKLLHKHNSLGASAKKMVKADEMNKIQRAMSIFKQTGIDYKDVMKDVEAGKEVFLIGINEKKIQNGVRVEQIVNTYIHEIDAHLKNMLNGNPSTNEFDEHVVYFGLDQPEGNQQLNEYFKSIMDGKSIPYDQILPNSPAGKNKAEVEKAASNFKSGNVVTPNLTESAQ